MTTSSEKLSLFYIPGVFGDEPKQALFRQESLSQFQVTMLKLPDLNHDEAILSDLAATGRIIAGDIMRIQPGGQINIVGFSFGASLAVEIAYYLMSAGRNVGYLGLIDCPLKIVDTRHSVRGIVELLMAPRGLSIVSKNLLVVIKRIYRSRIKTEHFTKKQHDDVLTECRFEALRRWNPNICKANGIIMLSVFNFERSNANWKIICPNCKVIKIRSDHHHILIGPAFNRVTRMMSDAISTFLQQSEATPLA